MWDFGKTNMGHTSRILPPYILPLKMANKNLCSNINIIAGGFIGGGSSSFTRRKYVRQVFVVDVISPSFLRGVQGKTRVNITFFEEDVIGLDPHDNDPLVITMKHENWDMNQDLIEPGCSADVLLYDAF